MKFAIAGAGAMGCRFAYQLKQSGQEVILIDRWPAHIEAIRQNGLHVDWNGQEVVEQFPIYYPEEVTEQVDVVIVFNKAMQLADMLSAIQPVFGPDTAVVCLLNGLGHELVMKQYVAEENLVMGSTIWSAALDGPGRAVLHGVGSLSLQNFVDTPSARAKTQAIVAALDEAGLHASYSENVKAAIWRKACVNACGNAPTALLECDLGGFFDNPYTEELVSAIAQEFTAVAATQGVEFDPAELTQFIISASLKIREHHASMYQDLIINRRLTEVDYINGAVTRIGEAAGIPTPVNRTITQLVHMKELLLGAQ